MAPFGVLATVLAQPTLAQEHTLSPWVAVGVDVPATDRWSMGVAQEFRYGLTLSTIEKLTSAVTTSLLRGREVERGLLVPACASALKCEFIPVSFGLQYLYTSFFFLTVYQYCIKYLNVFCFGQNPRFRRVELSGFFSSIGEKIVSP